MNGWWTALRIARREAARAKGRSALVVALIGLPVLALAFAAVTYDSFRLTPTQEWEREFGSADAQVAWWYDGPAQQSPDGTATTSSESGFRTEPATEAELQAVLPPGGRLVPYRQELIDMRTATGVGGMLALGAELSDPIFEGLVELREGRGPAAADEVAVNRRAMERLGASIGDTVSTADGTGSYTVVGIVDFTAHLDEQLVLLPDAVAVTGSAPLPVHPQSWLWDAAGPVSWEQVRQLNQHGIVVKSRAVQLDPPPADQVDLVSEDAVDTTAFSVGIVIAGLGLLEVVLLAGPAFAVGARRRQRDLALVAANGGTPQHLRRIVLADGVVLGLAGAVIGTVVGIALAFGARPLLEEYLWQTRAGGYRVFPLALLGIAGLAILTGTLAALVPAVAAARQPVLRALTGRRGVVRSRTRWVMVGLAMIGLGTAITGWGAWQVSSTLILAGLVTGELGLVLCTPALVGLIARTGRFVPLSMRIALRDTARNRAAAAPAISAVMAAVAGGLALGIFLDSDEARQYGTYLPALPEGRVAVSYEWWTQSTEDDPGPRLLAPEHHRQVREAVSGALPGAQTYEVAAPACPAGTEPGIECGLNVEIPEQNICPAWQAGGELTEAEQRAAAEDERCQYELRYTNYQVANTVVDDGTDPELLRVLTGATGEEATAAAATLRAGGVVVTDPLWLLDGSATVVGYEFDPSEPAAENDAEQRSTVPGYALATATGPELTFVSPAAVAAAGLDTQVIALVAETTAAPTVAERDALAAALRAIKPELTMYVEQGPSSSSDPRLLVVAGVAAVVTLGAAAIATGLAAADRRGDLATLGAVGASPRVRRLLSLSQSGVIAGLGTLLGVAAGIGAAFAVLLALNQRQRDAWPPPEPYPIEVPWAVLALLLAVPLVAMLGAGLLTRSRLPIERRLV